MKLLLSQKNLIYEAIASKNLSPLLFEYQEIAGDDISNDNEVVDTIISYKNSNYFFSIQTNSGDYYVFYSPGNEKIEHVAATNHWESTFLEFNEWLDFLNREISQTDKWLELLDFGREYILEPENETANAKFTYDEIINIQTNTTIAKQKISLLPLRPEQIDELNTKLDYLVEQAKHQSKIDWKNLFIGTLIQTIIQLSITPDLMQKIWHTIIGSYAVIKFIIAK